MQLFIFGAGFTAQNFAKKNTDKFEKIFGTTRKYESFQHIEKIGINPLIFDGINPTNEIKDALKNTTHLLISIAPDVKDKNVENDHDPVLKNIKNLLQNDMPNLQQIIYLSTVGVYGNHDGEWVDETTECEPVSRRSIARLKAESQWQKLAAEIDKPLSILRLSGIYGKGRNTFMNIEKGKARRLNKVGQVFNRIHVEDIAAAIAKIIEQKAHGIFNITDSEPAPPQDVVTLACEIYGIDPPEMQDFETAELTPMARSFYGENKRVSNQKSKDILGMAYQYPNYKISLRKMFDENSWK